MLVHSDVTCVDPQLQHSFQHFPDGRNGILSHQCTCQARIRIPGDIYNAGGVPHIHNHCHEVLPPFRRFYRSSHPYGPTARDVGTVMVLINNIRHLSLYQVYPQS